MDDDTGPSRSSESIAVRSTRGMGARLGFAAFFMLPCGSAFAESTLPTLSESPLFLGLIVLLACAGLLGAIRSALVASSSDELAVMATSRGLTGRLGRRISRTPLRFSTSILVAKSLLNLTLAITMPSYILVRLQVYMQNAGALVLAILLSASCIVIFSDLIPGVIGRRFPRHVLRLSAALSCTMDFFLRPVVWLMLRITETFFRVTRLNSVETAPFLSDDELKSAVSEGEEQGVLEGEEGQMIQGILEFNDALLREILVPRPDIIALAEDATVGEALETFRKHDFSRMPVYRENLDQVVGLLFAKDLLSAETQGTPNASIGDLVRPARFVPETMTIHAFLKDAQRMHTHQAIVVDEYGGTEGLVTLEDAMEEVVGTIHNENEKPLFEKLSEGHFRVDGSLQLDELSELIGISIEDDKHETVAGFIMDQANKIPEVGDQSEHRGARFTVESVDGKRVSSLRVELMKERGGEPT